MEKGNQKIFIPEKYVAANHTDHANQKNLLDLLFPGHPLFDLKNATVMGTHHRPILGHDLEKLSTSLLLSVDDLPIPGRIQLCELFLPDLAGELQRAGELADLLLLYPPPTSTIPIFWFMPDPFLS